MKHYAYLPGLVLILSTACANRGIGPQGGPIDSIPPVVVKTNPQNGVLNNKEKTIQLQFNEYVLLDNPSENVLVSPPQLKQPEIQSTGKKIKLVLQDELKDSTTYTIDFGNAIQDNNEKNPLKDYVFSFSTGSHIDSLEIYGTLINAENLNPLPGIVVGFHSCMDDSAFSTRPFERIGRTNTEGEFAIRNVHEGTYRIMALEDQSRDYIYQPGEGLAFLDSTITPSIHIVTETDTIYRDSIAGDSTYHLPDSVVHAEYYYFEPSELLLRFFHENKQHHYYERVNRDKAHVFTLIFAAPNHDLPTLKALRPERDSLGTDSSWVDFTRYCLCQANNNRDTITYWLTDSAAIKMDTIRFEMSYYKTDSVYALQPAIDTIQAIYRHPPVPKKAKKNAKKTVADTTMVATVAKLVLNVNAKSPFHLKDTVCLLSPTPIREMHNDSIHLFIKQDTLWIPIPFSLHPQDSTYMRQQVHMNIQADKEYLLMADSGATTDIYGAVCPKSKWTWKTRPIEDYATLMIHVQPYVEHAFIQLLNEKDEPVLTCPAEANGTMIRNMMPGAYYMRMFIDANGDGKWTTGDWKTKRQPEEVYYFSKKLTLRANWDFEETFLWNALPLLQQKPKALLPKTDKNQNKQK